MFVLSVLEAPNTKTNSLCVQTHVAIKLFPNLIYSIFTQVSKTFNSTVALQVDSLKYLGDAAAVLLDLVCLSLFCFFTCHSRQTG